MTARRRRGSEPPRAARAMTQATAAAPGAA